MTAHRPLVSCLALAVAAAGLVLLAAGCSSSATPSKSTPRAAAPPPGVSDAYSVCFNRARAAGDAVQRNGWGVSDDYARFTATLDTLAGGVLTPAASADGPATADWFERDYQQIVGRSPWVNDAARAKFEEAQSRCVQEIATATVAPPPGPTVGAEVEARIICLGKALYATEQRFGKGSTAYSSAFLQWVHESVDEDEGGDQRAEEAEYEQDEGTSPFANPDAMTSFRQSAATC
jgi:hypothetical protein